MSFPSRYSEDKASSAVFCPPIKQSTSGKNVQRANSMYKSFDSIITSTKKPKLSSQYTPKTARSMTIRWIDQSTTTFATVCQIEIRFQ